MPSNTPTPKHPALRRLLRVVNRLSGELHAILESDTGMEGLPDHAPPRRLKEITPTEFRVWKAIAADADEKYDTIRRGMGMSKRTYDNHVNNLYKKLGVHKRHGATRMWERYGKGRLPRA
jgi:DNA-binding CsgD family transcriptional regulator